jgi:cytokinin dehydrogenase
MMSKRKLLQAGLSLPVALASRADSMAMAVANGCPPPSADGKFLCDPHSLSEAAEDFGHIIRKYPRAVFKPATTADIAGILRWAVNRRIPVAARGQGHSTYGRAMAGGGIVIDMALLNTVHHIAPDHVIVDAGATWGSVLTATLPRGLTPPVLCNYLGLSVGGTLTVGGIGGTTSRHGMQTDNILALDIVTGDGRELTCSAASHPGLFDAVRAGLGQCGIITRATLRLVRAPERVRYFQLAYHDLRTLTEDLRAALADNRFNHLQGAILPGDNGGWRYQLEGAVFYDKDTGPESEATLAGLSDDRSAAAISDMTYLEFVSAFARFEALLHANGQWFNPHPWLLTFLRGSNAEQFARGILDELTGEDIGTFGRITYYPMFTEAVRTPLVRLPDENIVFPFNLIRIPATDDEAELQRMIIGNQKIYNRIRMAGGVQYPVGVLPMSNQDWKDHFGPAWSDLREAKRRYDSQNILTPGYMLF